MEIITFILGICCTIITFATFIYIRDKKDTPVELKLAKVEPSDFMGHPTMEVPNDTRVITWYYSEMFDRIIGVEYFPEYDTGPILHYIDIDGFSIRNHEIIQEGLDDLLLNFTLLD